MKDIKTYRQVNRTDTRVNFAITQMETFYEISQGEIYPPHRHDYYTVIISKDSKGKHIIDFNEYELSKDQIFFVSPGQVHQVIEYQKSTGYVITFSPQFLINNNIPLSFISDLNLFNDYGQSPPLAAEGPSLQVISGYCEELISIVRSDIKFKEQAIGSFLKLLLIKCNNICALPKHDNPQIIEAGYSILKKFKELVESHYTEWHHSAQYARQLNITPDHLNRTIQSLSGKTAKVYIQTRVCIAAKRMLYFSDLSTKEIGYKLGFSEASNFSSFFKKNTNLSPTAFRKNR